MILRPSMFWSFLTLIVAVSGVLNAIPIYIGTCNQSMTVAGQYILNINVLGGTKTCFNVYGDNIEIDCDGYSMTGSNVVNTFGVYSNASNTTIKNCIIDNFANAIRLVGATNGNYSNNTLIPDAGKLRSLMLVSANSTNNLIYRNNFTETSGLYANDLNGTDNKWNGTTEGNIWFDVMNGTIPYTGLNKSPSFPNLWIADTGATLPYNSSISTSVVGVQDWHPLTPTETVINLTTDWATTDSTPYFTSSTTWGIDVFNVSTSPNSSFKNCTVFTWSGSTLVKSISQNTTSNGNFSLASGSGLTVGYTYKVNATCYAGAGNKNSTTTRERTLVATPSTSTASTSVGDRFDFNWLIYIALFTFVAFAMTTLGGGKK